jgi:predicted metalloprotease
MGRYRGRWVTAVACAVLVLGGCSGGGDGSPPFDDVTTSETGDGGATSDGGAGDGGANGDAANGDVGWEAETEDAVAVVNNFWVTHWNDYFTGTYQPPRVAGAYTAGSPDAPTCGGEPAEQGNAFYCIDADFLAWDVQLMADGYRSGDSWVYLVVAHEWGHSVQNQVLGLEDVAQELQADCLAGATLFGSADLEFEEGDTEELAAALAALADDTPWTDSSDHGDASERISFFDAGGQGGVGACMPTG